MRLSESLTSAPQACLQRQPGSHDSSQQSDRKPLRARACTLAAAVVQLFTHSAHRHGAPPLQDGDGDGAVTDACNAVSARGLRRAVRDATAATEKVLDRLNDDDRPQTQDLLEVVRQQATLMAKYQRQLDATNARLTQSQKLLSQLISNTPVRTQPCSACLGVFRRDRGAAVAPAARTRHLGACVTSTETRRESRTRH